MKYLLKSFVFCCFVLALFVWLPAGTALADNGPHGGYTPTTDACAACHQAHTAGAAKLLQTTVPNLCYTCHGNAATGADTDVVDGIYDGLESGAGEGTVNRGLKAGGFTNALIDTDWDLVSTSSATTSSHLNDGSTGTAWGNGGFGSGAGAAGFSLSCVSCHNPHGGAGTTGSPTYRLLRAVPTGSGAGTGVDVTDESSKTYTVSNGDNQYFGENYGSRAPQLSDWCAQCHTRYEAASGSGHTDSGDPIFAYRHMTDGSIVGCVNCHVAHGTSASMSGYASGVAWPDGSTTPSGDYRSSLLRVDNRGVCELCHLK